MVSLVEVCSYGDHHRLFELEVNTRNGTLTWCGSRISGVEKAALTGHKLF